MIVGERVARRQRTRCTASRRASAVQTSPGAGIPLKVIAAPAEGDGVTVAPPSASCVIWKPA